MNDLSWVGKTQIEISNFLLFVVKITDLEYWGICLSLLS